MLLKIYIYFKVNAHNNTVNLCVSELLVLVLNSGVLFI